MISSAVAADLATNEEVAVNSEALSTVSGIIDGTGSIGAGFGELTIGALAAFSWDLTFGFLIVVAISSIVMLIPLVRKEYRMWKLRKEEAGKALREEN